ncbi:hypothetical protein LTR10_019993 [Elasticomyces elasticus]|uniref:NAD(P)-binding domain-containing protein n=1 Tax=Exophiala sideris TaxID=1016849 RepID=A0ABR0IXR0_9EURO|nr:hypothetical protein LTR10_019993 [Elasticomyces elasticus]KAK5022458.1 hypothetical protein LTS07_010118 [Exophiala sideris]KAK5027182.1 hypothetical protein LTR13_009577 [Exophiala sideris]KAK5051312.1 hypothetical protein LTR69_010338 [Exophiala sideris]KAK5177722.1 hypothetical protein LTR44_009697 [Eurotiomycetes sp. CCFEE 6388]
MSSKQSTIGVLGPSGMGGSHITVELLHRGHKVVGISRNPGSIGSHPRYEPRSVDIDKGSIDDLSLAFTGLDVVINAYGPHSSGASAMKYEPYVEGTRKIILATKKAKVGYLLMIGGCGSLYLPGTQICAVDSSEFWSAYYRSMVDSYAQLTYVEKRFNGGAELQNLRAYRSARIALREGRDTPEAKFVREDHERKNRENDFAKSLITACRTCFLFFDGNSSFDWTFLSPPAAYRSGTRTGKYEAMLDYVPLKGDPKSSKDLEGRFRGISTWDLAVAVADEAENRKYKDKHWTVFAEMDDNAPAPAPYIDLSCSIGLQ